MRKRVYPQKRHTNVKLHLLLLLVVPLLAAWRFSRYVNTTVKPTLHQLAEYEARAATTQAIQGAVSTALSAAPTLCADLYICQGDTVQLDTARANAAKMQLLAAVQQALAAMPETDYRIPFGSLTDNSLLSGLGPGWHFTLQPQGYAEGTITETAQSLSINTTRCTANLTLAVTVNTVLDGRTATLTVTDAVPLASILVQGGVPQAYAGKID